MEGRIKVSTKKKSDFRARSVAFWNEFHLSNAKGVSCPKVTSTKVMEANQSFPITFVLLGIALILIITIAFLLVYMYRRNKQDVKKEGCRRARVPIFEEPFSRYVDEEGYLTNEFSNL
ncbi:DgyrCDS10040 [Dimorphilus gyrociliatus]|uniref:DgyrCDS10040 n=1 Tax=Dimorphilus gyrociliatus TaxID=2664684 RepID=A0A7I8W450_9ANNE|nr:DgyrCDS10040 [Dimorphilus gyrociliatus]